MIYNSQQIRLLYLILTCHLRKLVFSIVELTYFEPGRKIEQFLVNVIGKFDELKQTPY